MERIIDFHSHILPKMDDGSDSVETTRKLLELLKSQGVDTVCATPHFYRRQNNIEKFLSRRDEACKRLPEVDGIKVLVGAEVAYFSGICDCEDLDKLCLEGTRTLLLEMPFTAWTSTQMEDVISLILDKNYRVVLAHPERFLFDSGNRRMIEKMCVAGVGLQVNAETLISWRYRKEGFSILEATEYPYVGTDCHDLKKRVPRMGDARKKIERKLGKDFLTRIDKCMNEAIGDALSEG